MNVLNGVQNFLQLINDNWTTICIVLGLIIALYKKISNYLNLSNEEKIIVAKTHIKETILKLVTDAEEDYLEWSKAGAVKRAQVIEEIFLTYPVLSKVTDQETLIAWIDEIIDNALETLRDIIAENIKIPSDNDDISETI